jgi:hypothetical protein
MKEMPVSKCFLINLKAPNIVLASKFPNWFLWVQMNAAKAHLLHFEARHRKQLRIRYSKFPKYSPDSCEPQIVDWYPRYQLGISLNCRDKVDCVGAHFVVELAGCPN